MLLMGISWEMQPVFGTADRKRRQCTLFADVLANHTRACKTRQHEGIGDQEAETPIVGQTADCVHQLTLSTFDLAKHFVWPSSMSFLCSQCVRCASRAFAFQLYDGMSRLEACLFGSTLESLGDKIRRRFLAR
jgi:hypothetical protein